MEEKAKKHPLGSGGKPAGAAGRKPAKDPGGLSAIFKKYPRERSNLIPLLQAVQDHLGWLSEDAMTAIADYLHLPASVVYGVTTFYAQFYLTRQGRHRIKVCQGTACHVRGSRAILDQIGSKLGIHSGETTPDLKFSMERVACFGSCALAPVMVVDNKVHGRVTIKKAEKIVEGLE